MSLFVSVSATAQITCDMASSPAVDLFAFDVGRGVAVGIDATGSNATWEFDGTSWQQMPVTTPPIGSARWTYDSARECVAAISTFYQNMWTWNGTLWANAGPVPLPPPTSPTTPQFFGFHLTYHSGRKRVQLIGPGPGSSGVELHEWDGVAWTLLPTINAPPTRPSAVRQYMYHALAYDERREKLVLFGRTERLNGGNFVGTEARTWEWDEGGWVGFPQSGAIGHTTSMWFDRLRGRMLRYDWDATGAVWIHVWADDPNAEDAPTWEPIQYLPGPATQPLYVLPCYDPVRNRVYTYQSPLQLLAWLEDVHPAIYEPHGPGCTTPNAPLLRLTRPWTRAWLGGALEVTVHLATPPIALLVAGLSDQSFGGTPLPLSLAPFGMPGCDLRVAPDFALLGTGVGSSVPFTLPVPSTTSLIGAEFWQQSFVLAAGANPAGLLASVVRWK